MYEYGKDFTVETLADFFRRVQEKQENQEGYVKSKPTLSEQEEEQETLDGDFI